MARNERAQWARLDIDGVALLADLAAGMSLVRPVQFDEAAPLRCFGAAAAASVALTSGSFSGRVAQGAGCNCSVLTLTPHANGTHTEAAGHLTTAPLDAWRVIPQRLLATVLLTVEPEPARGSADSSTPPPAAADRLVTRAALAQAWPAPLAQRLAPRAAVIRTRPNEPTKFTGAAAAAPFLSEQAADELVARGIAHLVLDLPSADRTEDGGELTAHRIFFGLPRGSTTLADATRPDCTITELAYADDTIADGWYLLSLQSPAIDGDAVPSRPVLYPLRAG
jgi:kynurenine formamidase